MEDLIKRLQSEVGLTEDQAVKTISLVKEYMDSENVDIDWNKFFKGKYEEFSEKAKSITDVVSDKAHPYAEKVSDTVEDFLSKARKGAHDLSQKATEFFDDKKKS